MCGGVRVCDGEQCIFLCRFLGTSGQNIDDIFKFSSVNDRLAILENTFLWQHISPTSPDTLSECV